MNDYVILTSEFPYKNGEGYIAPELKYAIHYGRIFLLPICDHSKESFVRAIPEEVIVLDKKTAKKSKLLTLGAIFLSREFWNGVLDLRKVQKCTLRVLGELVKFIYSARCQACDIAQTLKENQIPVNGNLVIYSYWMDGNALAATYFKRKGCIAVCRAHGGDLYDERTPWGHQFLRKYLVEHLDYVFPVSYQGKAYFDRRIGVHDNVIPMHLGIEVNHCAVSHGDQVFHIVTCSSAIKLKRIDLLIEALSLVKGDFYWVHFGDGDQLAYLKELAQKSLPVNCFLFMGYADNQIVHGYYRTHQVDLFVNVSETEGVPVSIMEALSYGIPVLATDVGGISELITDGCNGSLVDVDLTPEALSETIEKYMAMTQEAYLDYRMAAKESFKNNWSSEVNYRKFYDVIQKHGNLPRTL